MNDKKYDVALRLFPQHDLYHLSNVLSGLFSLTSSGEASIRFSSKAPADPSAGAALILQVREQSGGQSATIAIDLYDRSDYFSNTALEICDVYYKRSYFRPDLDALPDAKRARIRPFGMNYACRSTSSTAQVFAHLLPEYLKRPFLLKDRDLLDRLRKFLTSPVRSSFEQPPSEPLDRVVCFQTRLWEPESLGPDSAEEVNEPRAALVRLLRKEFGSAFRGGLVPNAYTQEHYPDAVATNSSRRSHYVSMSKRALIGVNTRGLHHSVPFKLPEYLAASKCIVSDPIRNELPAPLERNRHYLEFHTLAECVQECSRLFQDAALAEQMRHCNWHYYDEHIRSDRLLMKCFEDTFHGSA